MHILLGSAAILSLLCLSLFSAWSETATLDAAKTPKRKGE